MVDHDLTARIVARRRRRADNPAPEWMPGDADNHPGSTARYGSSRAGRPVTVAGGKSPAEKEEIAERIAARRAKSAENREPYPGPDPETRRNAVNSSNTTGRRG